MSKDEKTFIKYPFPLPAESAACFSVSAAGLAKAELIVGGTILSVLEFDCGAATTKYDLDFLGNNIAFQCALCDDSCINIYIDSAFSEVPSLTLAEMPTCGDRGQMFTQDVAPRNSAGEILKKTLAYIDGRVGFIRRN